MCIRRDVWSDYWLWPKLAILKELIFLQRLQFSSKIQAHTPIFLPIPPRWRYLSLAHIYTLRWPKSCLAAHTHRWKQWERSKCSKWSHWFVGCPTWSPTTLPEWSIERHWALTIEGCRSCLLKNWDCRCLLRKVDPRRSYQKNRECRWGRLWLLPCKQISIFRRKAACLL